MDVIVDEKPRPSFSFFDADPDQTQELCARIIHVLHRDSTPRTSGTLDVKPQNRTSKVSRCVRE